MKKKNKQLFIIDTFALIFRSYYALKARESHFKQEQSKTNVVYGFAKMINALTRSHQPDYVIFALDSPGDTFRHALSEDYKSNRKETPLDLREQIPKILELIEKMQLPMFSKHGFEADDVIGSLVRIFRDFKEESLDISIISSDKDLLQLVDERAHVLMMKRGVSQMDVYDKEHVYAKWGVYPSQIVDLFALIGDASDNIFGVHGIGKKTGAKLIQDYGSLDNIYRDVNLIPSKLIQKKLKDSRDIAYLSRQLVQIRSDLDMDIRQFHPIDLNQIQSVSVPRVWSEYENNSLF